MTPAALALGMTIAGVVTLHASWRHPHARHWPAVTGGWLLLAGAVAAWIRAAGAEFGIAYAALAVPPVAGILIVMTRDARGTRRETPRPWAPARLVSRHAIAHAACRACVAIPLAGAASLLTSVAFITPLPWSDADRYVLAIVVAPVVWGFLSTWAAVTSRLACTAAVFSIIVLAASAILSAGVR